MNSNSDFVHDRTLTVGQKVVHSEIDEVSRNHRDKLRIIYIRWCTEVKNFEMDLRR